MFAFQQKITRHTKKQVSGSIHRKKKQARETIPERAQMSFGLE